MNANSHRPIETDARITCPHCAAVSEERMPLDACTFFYFCTACETTLEPKAGDCCVFCSYADVPCPPAQQNGNCRETTDGR